MLLNKLTYLKNDISNCVCLCLTKSKVEENNKANELKTIVTGRAFNNPRTGEQIKNASQENETNCRRN